MISAESSAEAKAMNPWWKWPTCLAPATTSARAFDGYMAVVKEFLAAVYCEMTDVIATQTFVEE
jgi:hypothetical protein